MGLTLRAVGQGFRVYIVQFMKGQGLGGELQALKRLEPFCQVEYFGAAGWVHQGGDISEHKQEALRALQRSRDIIISGEWDFVILDEVFNAIWFELIPETEVLTLLELKPAKVELVLTGRNAAKIFWEKSDLVTEMVQRKHPYEQGIPARPGVEY